MTTEQLITTAKQSRAEVGSLRMFARYTDPEILATISERATNLWRAQEWVNVWVFKPLAAVPRFVDLARDLKSRCEALRSEIAAAQARFDSFAKRPVPTPGTKESNSLALEAQHAEKALDALRRELSMLEPALVSDDEIAAVREGLRRLLLLSIERYARESVTTHLDSTRDQLVRYVNMGIDTFLHYSSLCQVARAVTQSPMQELPVWRQPDSWAAIKNGAAPKLEYPKA